MKLSMLTLPRSATVPVYACETSPASIRGAMAMQWQVFTAFGIMLGFAFDLAFYYVPDTASNIHGLNWRLMMGSAGVPALFVCFFVFYCPESPRWYMSKGRHQEAYQAMCRIRHTKVQAARDVFQMHMLLEAENNMGSGQNHVMQLFTVPRIRRAMVASEITMFMQQVSYMSSFNCWKHVIIGQLIVMKRGYASLYPPLPIFVTFNINKKLSMIANIHISSVASM